MICTVMSVGNLRDEGTEGGPSLRYVCERGALQRWEGAVEGHSHGHCGKKKKKGVRRRRRRAQEMGEEF